MSASFFSWELRYIQSQQSFFKKLITIVSFRGSNVTYYKNDHQNLTIWVLNTIKVCFISWQSSLQGSSTQRSFHPMISLLCRARKNSPASSASGQQGRKRLCWISWECLEARPEIETSFSNTSLLLEFSHMEPPNHRGDCEPKGKDGFWTSFLWCHTKLPQTSLRKTAYIDYLPTLEVRSPTWFSLV